MELAPFQVTTLVYVCFYCALAMVLLKMFVPQASRWLPALIFAFLIAIVGDYFLKIRTGQLGFILGIFGYFLAHIGFLVYAWHNISGRRRYSWPVLLLIAVPFLVFYFVMLWPSLQAEIPLAIAVLLYLIISCMTLSASIDLRAGRSWKWIYAIGVAFLVFSDTLIALHSFADRHELYGRYMWPTFYSAMVFIALAVLLQHLLARNPLRSDNPQSNQYRETYEYLESESA
ncbi:MAG: lysoplasmalogenase [Cellulomonadaceae bacterium]|jgi:hypothetical protein|nr:lysoplasmalogenase [Cellulomonadaceae bacterium]